MAYHPIGNVFDEKFFEKLPYRTVGFKNSETKFAGRPLPKQMPGFFERLTSYAKPDTVKKHSRLRYSNNHKTNKL